MCRGKRDQRSMLGGGRHAMSLLRRPFSHDFLERLAERPAPVNELMLEIPDLKSAAAYRYVKELKDKGALEKRPASPGDRGKELVLTGYGRSLADLALLHEQWFSPWPYDWGEMSISSELGQLVISSKVEGWGPQILWGLEEEPRTMGWLESRLGNTPDADLWGFDSAARIRHRVQMMLRTGQIEVVDPDERPVRYRPTRWSYRGAGCLAFAVAMEMHHRPPGCKPPSVRVIAFGLVQAGHMIQAAEDVSGIIQVVIPVEGRERPIEIHYEVTGGRMTGWRWGRAANPTATGVGPLIDWLAKMIGLSDAEPEVSGDRVFFNAVLAGVQQGLFAPDLGLLS